MMKMVIADDEYIVREGLKNIKLWEEYGIEIVGDACDGKEAFELCVKLQPDILFTDIRMPIMDGLEVAMKLKEDQSNIKVIMLSGIQDFNYVKTAMDINAEGYILKPVKINELRSVITKVVNSIKMERNREHEITSLKQELNDSIPVIRENFLRNLISGFYQNENEIKEKIKYLDIPLKSDESAVVAVFQIDEYENITMDNSEEDRQLLNLSVNNIIKRIIQEYGLGVSFAAKENEFVVIYNQNSQLRKKYIEVSEEIMVCVNKFSDKTISVGIGRATNKLSGVSISYREALDALEYKFYTGRGSLISIYDIYQDEKDIDFSDLYKLEQRLMNYMKLGDTENVLQIIDTIFIPLLYSDAAPCYPYIKSICIELICTAQRVVYETGEDMKDIVADHSVILSDIFMKKDMLELKNYVKSVFIQLVNFFEGRYKNRNAGVVRKIKNIINERYMENISVAMLSEEVYLTPNYISLIFKRETGETIVEYLTRVRMEAAKKLLETSELKVFEIAEMVGYENSNYFSTVFKKYTGIYPGKYCEINKSI